MGMRRALARTAAVVAISAATACSTAPTGAERGTQYRPEMKAIYLSLAADAVYEQAGRSLGEDALLRLGLRYCTDRSEGIDTNSAIDHLKRSDDLISLSEGGAEGAAIAVTVAAEFTVCTDYHSGVGDGRPGTSSDPSAPEYEDLRAFLEKVSGEESPPGSLGNTDRSRAVPSAEWVFLELVSADLSESEAEADDVLAKGYMFCLAAGANGVENAITVTQLSEPGGQGTSISFAAAMELCPEFYLQMPDR